MNEITNYSDMIKEIKEVLLSARQKVAQPIGLILCIDKSSVETEYALGGLSNNNDPLSAAP